MSRLIQHCVEQLSRHLHDTIVRVYREGLSLRGAATVLGSSPAAVAQRLSRARDLIRKCVAERRETES
jgi:DNA-directed RNA polymerase specialized sigma24 family protein